MTQDDDDDEKLELSGNALVALQEFYSERDDSLKRFEKLKNEAEVQASQGRLSMDMFSEDWNASQFWYSEETAGHLAEQLLKAADEKTNIAVVSAPSVFVQLKNILGTKPEKAGQPSISLLEFDERFNVFPEFVKYDYQQPLKLDGSLKGRFDRVLCDPPFLSPDCQTKAAMTVRWLLRKVPGTTPRVIVCTGERMEDLVHRLYGIRTTDFEPRHAQDRLSNDFRCYADYECDLWKWR